MPSFVLASASPARLATLRSAGLDPLVVVSGVDESVLDGLEPRALAVGLAELKCRAVVGRPEVPAGALVLGCDSVLELDGQALGKPGSPQEAIERWAAMRGRSGVPLHVAGAFTVDGLGGAFVRGIEGDHHNVVGVSLPVLREMVGELGHRWTDLWAPAR